MEGKIVPLSPLRLGGFCPRPLDPSTLSTVWRQRTRFPRCFEPGQVCHAPCHRIPLVLRHRKESWHGGKNSPALTFAPRRWSARPLCSIDNLSVFHRLAPTRRVFHAATTRPTARIRLVVEFQRCHGIGRSPAHGARVVAHIFSTTLIYHLVQSTICRRDSVTVCDGLVRGAACDTFSRLFQTLPSDSNGAEAPRRVRYTVEK